MYWLVSVNILAVGLIWSKTEWLLIAALFALIDVIDRYVRHKYPTSVTTTKTTRLSNDADHNKAA